MLLQAAADPTRLAILRQSSDLAEVCARDFTACCDVSQPTRVKVQIASATSAGPGGMDLNPG